MTSIRLTVLFSFLYIANKCVSCQMKDVFSWKQITYNFDGVKYLNSTDTERKPNGFYFVQELTDSEKFFIQYNNVPIGLEVYRQKVFITVPRRRHGIPSTLNYVDLGSTTPQLRPYPDTRSVVELVSVYRPRVDECGRLWVVDTGLLEVPGARRQIQPPSILVFSLKTNKQILRYALKPTDLVNERSSGGLTSITVDVDPKDCENAYAYINDLATESLIVFSMRERDSWRINHPSFVHDDRAVNFTSAGYTINWRDGLFSIALSNLNSGKRRAFYHPLVSTQEFAIDTDVLKSNSRLDGKFQMLGNRGPNTQSGSHGFHGGTEVLFFASVSQDAISCWNTNKELKPSNVATVAQDHNKLVYISDLKIVGDEVWVLSNQIPRFIYFLLNPMTPNYFVLRGNVRDLIRGTVCDRT